MTNVTNNRLVNGLTLPIDDWDLTEKITELGDKDERCYIVSL